MSSTLGVSTRAARMRFMTGPSVWLEFTPLAQLTSSVNLGQGAPNWGSPTFVKDALAAAALDDKCSQYAPPMGASSLVDAIAHTYGPKLFPRSQKSSQFDPSLHHIDPRSQIVITDGASQALSLACTALLSPGDEVILLEPSFDIYSASVRMSDGVPVPISLRPRTYPHSSSNSHAPISDGIADGVEGDTAVSMMSSEDLVLDMNELVAKFSPRTRMLFLNSPHNPTGKVFSREELKAIAEAIEQHAPNCIVLSDEVYEHIVFEEKAPHIPFASVSPSAYGRTISVYSAGKTFSATGLKIGWAIGPRSLIQEMQLAQQYVVFCVNHLSQVAVANMLSFAERPYRGFSNYYEWLRTDYCRKRDALVKALEKAGLKPIVPQGAFFICAYVPSTHPARKVSGLPGEIRKLVDNGLLTIDEGTVSLSDYNSARNLALQSGVISIPISTFFAEDRRGKELLSQNYVRFAFCHPDNVLDEAGQRLLKSVQ